MIAVAFFTILVVIFEIPTGVVGDKLGYKKTLILGAVITLAGSVGYALSRNFYHVLIAEFFWGLGFSFYSGTQDSFLYDTLKNLKREKEFNRINGIATALFWSGFAVSSILGGFLANINLRWPIYFAFIPLIIPVFVVSFFVEPKRKKKKLSHMQHAVKSFKYVISHKKLRFLLFYTVLIYLVLEGSYKFFQPMMYKVGINIALFGLIFAFGYLISGIGALISHKLEEYLKEKKILYLLYITAFLTLLFLSQINSVLVLIGIFILLILDGVSGPLMTDYMNKNIESYNRATVNSISSLTRNVTLAILLPLLGYFGDNFGVNRVFLINSLIIIIGFILIKSWYKKI